jgi:phosphoribosylglycinamide formyltransferase
VLPTDTPQDVAARVLAEEHRVFPHALAALVEGRVEFREDGVPRIVKPGTTNEYE